MVINGNIFNYIFPKIIHRKGKRKSDIAVTESIFIPRTQEYVKDNGLFGKIII